MFVIFYKLFLNETDYFSKYLAYFTVMGGVLQLGTCNNSY